ncbi:T9SS type A sorting domain-containing protein [Catalinimonas alkaloidigena]|nr:T9SS type A sorting domain-containing protein [Catalinimonas alkaloidigena]
MRYGYFLLLSFFLLTGTAVRAQSTFDVSVEQSVQHDTLYLDFFVRKTSGTDFVLGSANFAVQLSADQLDVARKFLVETSVGPWDSRTMPGSYNALSVGGKGFVNVSIFQKTSGNGAGRAITSTKQRIARVGVPVLSPCGINHITWLQGPMALFDFAGNDIKAQAQLVAPASLDLKKTFSVPTVVSSNTTICAGTTALLTAQGKGSFQWFRNGVAIEGATAAELIAETTGDYAVQASLCDTSLRSTSVHLDVVEPQAGAITQLGDTLVADQGLAYQWYLDGQPIAGAMAQTWVPTANGVYNVEVTSLCGTTQSEPYDYYTTPVAETPAAFRFEVYPNPYQVATSIHYQLPKAGPVLIEVYNATGVKVATLVDKALPAGAHTTDFGAAAYGQGSGYYLIRFTYEGATATYRALEIR